MKIGLDYDETFTAAPVFWEQVVLLAKEQGHSIKFVTYRDGRYTTENEDIITDAEHLGIEVVFTGGKQKQHICPEVDIWIDDSPETIVNSTKLGDMYDDCLTKNDMQENYNDEGEYIGL